MRVGTTWRRSWRQHRIGVLAVLAVLALLLGFVGYVQADATVLDAIYGTLALLAFTFEEPSGSVPPTLQAARFMAPAAAAFATLTVLTALLEDQWHLARARARRNHVVVCGLGRRGIRLVRSILSASPPGSVVAIESDHANPNIAVARSLGAIVIIGDSTDVDLLHTAGVHRASTLISVLPDDADNANIASLARTLCAKRADPLHAFCHVADGDLIAELTSASLPASGAGLTVEWFSIPERAARLLLRQHADLIRRSGASRPPHIVVVGNDELAEALVITAARQWRSLAGAKSDPISLTVAWAGAAGWLQMLVARHPSIAELADLRHYEEDLSAANPAGARQMMRDATLVIVCGTSDTVSLRLGFAISRLLGDRGSLVIRMMLEHRGFAELLEAESSARHVSLFSVIDQACSLPMVTDGLVETIARAFHELYLEQAPVDSGAVGEAPLVRWEELATTFKAANRAQARAIKDKLAQVGCGLRPLVDWNAEVIEFSESEVEEIAISEHERWNTERKARDWVPGRAKDLVAKTNPWIDVPWEQLPEEIRDYDRLFAGELPKVLAAAGYEVYRTVRSIGQVSEQS